MAQLMLKPSPQLVERYRIPPDVIAAAYTANPAHHAETLASLSKIRKLCGELGLLRQPYPLLWKVLRLQAKA